MLYVTVHNKGTFPLTRSGSGAVIAVRSGFLGHSVFMVCVSTMAGRSRGGGGCPRRVRRNGSWGHFSAPPCEAVAVWRQLSSSLLKYRSCDIDIKDDLITNRPTYLCAVDQPVKFRSDCRTMSISRLQHLRNLRIRHLNRLLNKASTESVVMLMKTKL